MGSTNTQTILIAYIISNIAGLLLAWLSWKKPNTARMLYLLLFIGAGWINVKTALSTPQVYLDYANFTVFPFYKNFILGFFGQHIISFVCSIAVCQLFIGIFMLLKGKLLQTGCLGGIIFLVCISPLGIGAAFPATLTMATGLYLLMRKNISHYLISI